MHVYTDTGVTEYPPNGIAVRTWFEGQGIEGAEHEFGMTRNQIYYENADDSLKGFRLMRTPSVGMFFEDSGAKLSGTRVHDFDGPRISSDASQVEGQMGILYKAQDGTVTTASEWILPESTETTNIESV